MKRKFLYFSFLIPLLQGCVANDETGRMGPGWLFWVFLGLLLGGVFLGALTNLLRRKKPDDAPTKSEQEIEAYEETLERKLNENSEDPDKNKDKKS